MLSVSGSSSLEVSVKIPWMCKYGPEPDRAGEKREAGGQGLRALREAVVCGGRV